MSFSATYHHIGNKGKNMTLRIINSTMFARHKNYVRTHTLPASCLNFIPPEFSKEDSTRVSPDIISLKRCRHFGDIASNFTEKDFLVL
ncbi:hypothetical protein NPIL_222721 [Nephila pilipes]|uniref:Uncharacterized protein n=1 Tax=Nephila pilipes TaxID=299642 RepID=A0A8X6U167_NEPPI|nr:hypothetical protein NPIL_222721 [Nephila pilipes]